MSRAGSSSRKLPARTSSMSWHSLSEALWTLTARGRLLVAAIARVLVPLPRRVGPTAKPLFSRWQRGHQQRPLPDSVYRPHADVLPTDARLVPIGRFGPTVGSGDDRFEKVDICPATLAIGLRFPAPRELHSKLPAYHATGVPVCRNGARAATLAPTSPTARQLLPSVHASVKCRVLQSSPSCLVLPSHCYSFSIPNYL